MNNKYTVSIEFTFGVNVEVEAYTEREAVYRAEDALYNGKCDDKLKDREIPYWDCDNISDIRVLSIQVNPNRDKNKYVLSIDFTFGINVEVEAYTEREAVYRAEDALYNGKCDDKLKDREIPYWDCDDISDIKVINPYE